MFGFIFLTDKGQFMATVKQVLADLAVIKSNATSYVAARDAIDATKDAALAAALANATIPADVQADIDAAFDAAEAAKGQLSPVVPAAIAPVPVVEG